MTETALATTDSAAALAEQVVVKGDLSKLTEAQRMTYYTEVCRSLGLNPLTRPFEYITLNNKLTLYATRAAGDQLRATRGITITNLEPRQVGELFVVTATGRDRTGREDASTGAVSTTGLRGDALANAMMKAETKAKRRLTLSLAGLGWTDETEVDSIPGASIPEPPAALTLAERAAQRAAELAPIIVAGVDDTQEVNPADQQGAPVPGDSGSAPATPATCGVPSPFDAEVGCDLIPGHLGVHRQLDAQRHPVATW